MKSVLPAVVASEGRIGNCRPPAPQSDPPLECLTLTCSICLPPPLHFQAQPCSFSHLGQKPGVILDSSFSQTHPSFITNSILGSAFHACLQLSSLVPRQLLSAGLSSPCTRPLLWALQSINTAASGPAEMQVNHIILHSEISNGPYPLTPISEDRPKSIQWPADPP